MILGNVEIAHDSQGIDILGEWNTGKASCIAVGGEVPVAEDDCRVLLEMGDNISNLNRRGRKLCLEVSMDLGQTIRTGGNHACAQIDQVDGLLSSLRIARFSTRAVGQ